MQQGNFPRLIAKAVESFIFGRAAYVESVAGAQDRFVVVIPEDFSLYSKIGDLIELVVGAIIDLREIAWSVDVKVFGSKTIEVSITAGFFGADPEMYGPLRIELLTPSSIVRPLVCAATGLYCDDKKRKRSLQRGPSEATHVSWVQVCIAMYVLCCHCMFDFR